MGKTQEYRREETRIQLRLSPEYEVKIKKILSKTSENKTDLFRRLIENELAYIEGRVLDVSGHRAHQDVMLEKYLKYIASGIARQDVKLDELKAAASKNLAVGYFANKQILRSMYLIVRLLFTQFKTPSDEIKERTEESDKLSTKFFKDIYDKVNEGLQSTIDFLVKK